MWINYPQTAYSLGVAPSFQSSELSNTSEMKKCSKCGEVKELVDFGNNIIMKDGLQPLCRDCKKMMIRNIVIQNMVLSHKYTAVKKGVHSNTII